MIVTFTANPSIDRTMQLDAPLRRGESHRAQACFDHPAGKGMNVAAVLREAGEAAVAVVAFADQFYLGLARELGGPEPLVALVRPGLRVRTNIAVTEPDGTTTKINEPGPLLEASEVVMVTDALVHITARGSADWVVMSGSIPPGAPDDWYVQLASALRPLGCRLAVDTSDQALAAVLAALPEVPVDLLKPNVDELAQMVGRPAADLQDEADRGDWASIIAGGQALRARGVAEVLVTLGAAGALLVSAEGVWQAGALPVEVRSTVGAGDASLAGYLLASQQGLGSADRLATAVAYGSAAAASPGTGIGVVSSPDVATVSVTRLV